MELERRDYDPAIAEIQKDIRKIMNILSPLDSNEMGLCEKVRNNACEIQDMRNKPSIIKGWIVASAIILNTILAGIAIYIRS